MRTSLYERHVAEWEHCRRCNLCEGRIRVVLARGRVPCDVLFIGEAPGESENVIGLPFIGPAGKLLDLIIRRSVGERCTYALTNLVACVPRGDDGAKTFEPNDVSIRACAPRLKQFVELCNPSLIVRVGKLAHDWLAPGFKHSIKLDKDYKFVDIVHPAAILRANVAQQSLAIQRCVVTIASAVRDICQS